MVQKSELIIKHGTEIAHRSREGYVREESGEPSTVNLCKLPYLAIPTAQKQKHKDIDKSFNCTMANFNRIIDSNVSNIGNKIRKKLIKCFVIVQGSWSNNGHRLCVV